MWNNWINLEKTKFSDFFEIFGILTILIIRKIEIYIKNNYIWYYPEKWTPNLLKRNKKRNFVPIGWNMVIVIRRTIVIMSIWIVRNSKIPRNATIRIVVVIIGKCAWIGKKKANVQNRIAFIFIKLAPKSVMRNSVLFSIISSTEILMIF